MIGGLCSKWSETSKLSEAASQTLTNLTCCLETNTSRFSRVAESVPSAPVHYMKRGRHPGGGQPVRQQRLRPAGLHRDAASRSTELANEQRRRLPALPDLSKRSPPDEAHQRFQDRARESRVAVARQVLVGPALFRDAHCCCRGRKGKKGAGMSSVAGQARGRSAPDA